MTNKTPAKPRFKTFTRFDENKASKGYAHRIEDEVGNYYGTFTTRFFDPHNKQLKAEAALYERDYASDKRAKGKLAAVHSFVNIILLDWSEVPDEDGNDIPFSRETAFELFSQEDGDSWLFNELFRRSRDARYYAPSLTVAKEDIAGN